MIKSMTINAVLKDLEDKREQLEETIKLLRKTYGKEVVEGEFEEVREKAEKAVGSPKHNGAKPWFSKLGYSLTKEVMKAMKDGKERRASDVAALIKKRTGKTVKKQSVLAQLSNEYRSGNLTRLEKGLYRKEVGR